MSRFLILEFPDFLCDFLVLERNLLEKWGTHLGNFPNRMLPWFPGANIKEFLLTILSEAKRPQTQCLSPTGEFWVCSEANSIMVKNSFQRAQGNQGNRPQKFEANKQRSHVLKFRFPIKLDTYKDISIKTQETSDCLTPCHQ